MVRRPGSSSLGQEPPPRRQHLHLPPPDWSIRAHRDGRALHPSDPRPLSPRLQDRAPFADSETWAPHSPQMRLVDVPRGTSRTRSVRLISFNSRDFSLARPRHSNPGTTRNQRGVRMRIFNAHRNGPCYMPHAHASCASGPKACRAPAPARSEKAVQGSRTLQVGIGAGVEGPERARGAASSRSTCAGETGTALAPPGRRRRSGPRTGLPGYVSRSGTCVSAT
jgi:hypothetical protein